MTTPKIIGYTFELHYSGDYWSGRLYSESIKDIKPEDLRNVVPHYATPEDALVDAERWRTLMSSPKLHFMGSAGFDYVYDQGDQRPTSIVPREGEGLHFGMEFWSYQTDLNGRYPDTFEREFMVTYVDEMRRRKGDNRRDIGWRSGLVAAVRAAKMAMFIHGRREQPNDSWRNGINRDIALGEQALASCVVAKDADPYETGYNNGESSATVDFMFALDLTNLPEFNGPLDLVEKMTGDYFTLEECSLLRQMLTIDYNAGKLNSDGAELFKRLCDIEAKAAPHAR